MLRGWQGKGWLGVGAEPKINRIVLWKGLRISVRMYLGLKPEQSDSSMSPKQDLAKWFERPECR